MTISLVIVRWKCMFNFSLLRWSLTFSLLPFVWNEWGVRTDNPPSFADWSRTEMLGPIGLTILQFRKDLLS